MIDQLLETSDGNGEEYPDCIHTGVECEYNTDEDGNPICPCRGDCCTISDLCEDIGEEPLQAWYFTFETSHRMFAGRVAEGVRHVSLDQEGIDLFGRYVVIVGTFQSAHEAMSKCFGRIWCRQHTSLEDATMGGILPLKELKLW